MPTYDYKCLECDYNFESFQSMKDKHLTECPKCGGKIKRLIGAGSTPIFRGTGFYQTDYKKPPSAKKAATTPAKVEKPITKAE
ncbi:MAG: FmdB family transcriptional regulator [Ignavibacteria bacterium CG_4_8_14_3_um_filter_37_9]|nr:zinc ribbon domain-containing protein [Ignavibacteria bacterium]OIO14516.1 MAG: FmdB family transcriptional regulator [Ignavibacteria bacterium CG1_02_37_35]PIW98889.1 MAG: FmdB family transcriptional regulator [Ignavibacteria bacterium CG_4_8_14_3_um_filter_37_9]PIX93473.1 MAG: FmdB family transcriptional regulator [Ignavibacteria bacterium CG_4_10_14_3_um_filter_37_18]PJC57990.1 MAG: FmdB family transcriptional regulator [Ignavibacteria bacterium CG_4_9_14_0_2_um_filter_37_13]